MTDASGPAPTTGDEPPAPPRSRAELTPDARPPVGASSLVGAASGVFLALALVTFLSDLPDDDARLLGLALSLAFEAVGVALLVFAGGRRAATAGVALTAIGVVPLLVYVFVDVENPSATFDSVSSFTTTATLMLLAAAALWSVAHLFGPGRSHALYLGAALVAVYLAVLVQITSDPLRDIEAFTASAGPTALTFEPGGTTSGTGDGFGTLDQQAFDERMRQYDLLDAGQVLCADGELVQGDDSFWECDGDTPFPISTFDGPVSGPDEVDLGPVPAPSDPSADIAWTTLVFGVAYLGAAGALDRRRDHRRATAFLAVSVPLLYVAVIALGGPLNLWGQVAVALVLAALAIRLADRTDRRFTAWAATFGGAAAVFALLLDRFDDVTALGVAFLVVGALGFAVATMLDHRDAGPARPLDEPGPPPATPGGGDQGAWAPPTPDPAPGPAAAPPTPPDAPAVPAGLPTFEPPGGPAPLGAPTTPPERSPWAPPVPPGAAAPTPAPPDAGLDPWVPRG